MMVVIEQKELMQAIRQVMPAIDPKTYQQCYTGVLLTANGPQMKILGTTGFKISKRRPSVGQNLFVFKTEPL